MASSNKRPVKPMQASSTPKPALLGNAGHRYQMVANALLADIERGTYAVGDHLPSEMEISERYGISRYTTREAIRRLAEMGLVSRQVGIGTIVKARSTQAHYMARIPDLADLVHHTKQTRLKILSEKWVRIEGDLAEILPGATGQRWLRFSTLRYPANGKEPISYTEILVHPAYENIRARLHETNASVYQLIEDLRGERVREARQKITCMSMPAKVARLLGSEAGAPALYVLRCYLGKNDALMSASINYYPEKRFKVTTTWRLDESAA